MLSAVKIIAIISISIGVLSFRYSRYKIKEIKMERPDLITIEGE